MKIELKSIKETEPEYGEFVIVLYYGKLREAVRVKGSENEYYLMHNNLYADKDNIEYWVNAKITLK